MSEMLAQDAEFEPEAVANLHAVPGYVKQVLDALDEPNAAIDRKYWAAHELLAFGFVDKATEVLKSLPKSARRTSRLDRVEQIENGEALLKQVIPGVKTEVHDQLGRKLTGIMVLPSVQPTPFALIFFGGNGDRNFTLPHPLINRQHVHLIFIKDVGRCFSMCEIPRLGPSFETNLPLLKSILEELEATSVYCLGVSAGAFAALKFGLELGAQGVLAFSGTPTLNLEDDPGATMAKYPQLVHIYKKARHLATNMAVEYIERKTHPTVTMVYGEKHLRDAFFASHMADVPGVKLAPIEGFARHGSFTESLSKDRVTPLLDELFSAQQVNASKAR